MDRIENRHAYVTRHLARQLMSVRIGERIPTTSETAADLGVGFGTVEKSLTALKEADVIKTRARGQMGTFLLEKDFPKLWTATGNGAVVGLLPIPNSMLFSGLATGLTSWLETASVPFSLNFKNGARSRLSALRGGRADFIMVSKRSALLICDENPDIVSAFELDDLSYYDGHQIVKHPNLTKPREEWIIGVDPTSFDHIDFCKKLFPQSKMVDIRYVNLPYAIARGEIDASAVHSRSFVPVEAVSSLVVEPVEDWRQNFHDASAAVALCMHDNIALRSVFAEAENPLLIREAQRSVINGEREPEY